MTFFVLTTFLCLDSRLVSEIREYHQCEVWRPQDIIALTFSMMKGSFGLHVGIQFLVCPGDQSPLLSHRGIFFLSLRDSRDSEGPESLQFFEFPWTLWPQGLCWPVFLRFCSSFGPLVLQALQRLCWPGFPEILLVLWSSCPSGTPGTLRYWST